MTRFAIQSPARRRLCAIASPGLVPLDFSTAILAADAAEFKP
jgi:hypothetical protein